jgi:hypothetical protein
MRPFFSAAVVACVAVTVDVGCAAGSIHGTVDGDEVPAFADAAFGIVTADGEGAVQGYALPSDSCGVGANILDVTLDFDRDLATRNGEIADAINDNIPEDSWYVVLTVIAGDQDDIEDDTIDLEDRAEVAVDFVLCNQDTEATVDDAGNLQNGANCFFAAQGDVTLDIADDAGAYHVTGEGIEMVDIDEDDVGDVDLNFTFTRCAGLDDALDALQTPAPAP